MKKILFPFFNKVRHKFLIKTWWFRTIVVIYSICLIISIPFMRFSIVNNDYNNCINESITISRYEKNAYGYYPPEYYKDAIACNNMVSPYASRSIETFLLVLSYILISHYIIQLLFFKITIDYIVLGSKDTK